MKRDILVSDKILIFSLFVGCFYRKGPALRNDLYVRSCQRAKHKTYSPLDDCWVILTTSKVFHYFRDRRDEIRFAFDPPLSSYKCVWLLQGVIAIPIVGCGIAIMD